MKVCLVHNKYGKLSGEEVVVRRIHRLLEEHRHEVIPFIRSSGEIPGMGLGKARAFFSGIYSLRSRQAMRQLLAEHRPDLVHVHNLFPLISPSVLGVCARAGVPVVMTVHNYRLFCPNGLLFSHGQVCERCCGGHEYWCLFRNCEESFSKSLGYALRNWVARTGRLFLDNVTLYAALTQFQRQTLIAEGFPGDRIVVVPNMANHGDTSEDDVLGDYVGYAGRISPEKGIPTLLDAARQLPEIPFRAAGSYERMPHLPAQAPLNFEFLGHLAPAQLEDFYASSRAIALCSTWFEAFPLMLAETMLRGKPVVCSRLGGLPEIVDDGVTGMLFEAGNTQDLIEKIRYLWDRPDLCRRMGQAGREKALREYSPERYYQRLMAVYEQALERNRKAGEASPESRV